MANTPRAQDAYYPTNREAGVFVGKAPYLGVGIRLQIRHEERLTAESSEEDTRSLAYMVLDGYLNQLQRNIQYERTKTGIIIYKKTNGVAFQFYVESEL
jgi:hypothetical protein